MPRTRSGKNYAVNKKAAKKGATQPTGVSKPKVSKKAAQNASTKGSKKAKSKATINCSSLSSAEIGRLAQKYAQITNANKPFTWDLIKPGLTASARSRIRNVANASGLVAKGTPDPKQDYAATPPPPPPPFVIFPKKYIKATFTLPSNMYTDSDSKQFTWLDKQMLAQDSNYEPKTQTFKGSTAQYTWHHVQDPPGTMQLLEFGIHNRTSHAGGRNVWGGGTGSR